MPAMEEPRSEETAHVPESSPGFSSSYQVLT
jgi:hypothetical protein